MTVFYLLAVDLPSWVLGIDDRSLSCCVQSVFSSAWTGGRSSTARAAGGLAPPGRTPPGSPPGRAGG